MTILICTKLQQLMQCTLVERREYVYNE